MVIFDANILISYVTEDECSEIFRKLDMLIQDLVDKRKIIGIPAPAWAEFLAGAKLAMPEIINKFGGKRAIQILPFGDAEAIEAAEIERRFKRRVKGENQGSRTIVKYDRQILAIARTQNAEILYTDDDKMAKEANRLSIKVCKTDDLPLPPEPPQQELFALVI